MNKSKNSTSSTSAIDKCNITKNGKKIRNTEAAAKIRQNPGKLRSKRDMSANPMNQRNKVANELLKLEKSGALNNLPKV